jgi:hypothetical protein
LRGGVQFNIECAFFLHKFKKRKIDKIEKNEIKKGAEAPVQNR